jgi:hypothetical protein
VTHNVSTQQDPSRKGTQAATGDAPNESLTVCLLEETMTPVRQHERVLGIQQQLDIQHSNSETAALLRAAACLVTAAAQLTEATAAVCRNMLCVLILSAA